MTGKFRTTHISPVTPPRNFINAALAFTTLATLCLIPFAMLTGSILLALWLFELVR